MRPPQLSHTQAAPNQLRRPLRQNHQNASQQMPPPPLPPAKSDPPPSSNNFYHSMGPPQSSRDASGPPLNITPSRRSTDHQPNMNMNTTNRFLPPNERFPPPTGTPTGSANRRFVPRAATQASGTFRPATTSSHPNGASRTPLCRPQPKFSVGSGGGSGQRKPFVPGGGQ